MSAWINAFGHASRSRAGIVICCGLMVLGFAAGCEPSLYDPRVFDDLSESVWVHTSGAPEGIGSVDYGFALAGGARGVAGARLFVGARGTDGLAYLEYGADGFLQERALDLRDINTLDQANRMPDPLFMAAEPGAGLVAAAFNNGGSPEVPTQTTVALLDTVSGEVRALFAVPGSDLAGGLGFAVTDVAGSGGQNLALVRRNILTVIADLGDPAATAMPECILDGDLALSMAAADLDSAAPEQEIAIAVATGQESGRVHIVGGSLVSDAALAAVPPDPALCFDGARQPIATITAPGGERDFGLSLVVAELNGNGVADLVIAAPGSSVVYVYLDVDATSGLPAPSILQAPPGATGFATALAAGDLDGDGDDELIVAAPDTKVGGASRAGMVYLYDMDQNVLGAPVPLGDAQPEANQRFGRALAVVPMGAGPGMLIVGAAAEIFAYFRTPISDDVRTF